MGACTARACGKKLKGEYQSRRKIVKRGKLGTKAFFASVFPNLADLDEEATAGPSELWNKLETKSVGPPEQGRSESGDRRLPSGLCVEEYAKVCGSDSVSKPVPSSDKPNQKKFPLG